MTGHRQFESTAKCKTVHGCTTGFLGFRQN
jgi:hypothetical protein